MSGPLNNPRHEAFCQHYVSGKEPGNASAAYRAAGYAGRGSTAWAAASRLYHRPEVRARIEELHHENRDRAGTA